VTGAFGAGGVLAQDASTDETDNAANVADS
jgi:hypothetical protein